MSFKNWLRRKVHCLRRLSHRQDAVITLYLQHGLIAAKYGLRPVETYTSGVRAATSSSRRVAIFQEKITSG